MLILVVGPSGAGKDTLLNGLRTALGEHCTMRFVRRVITRPGDLGEEAHESATEQEFDLREQAGDFALSWRAHGLRYGIPADISFDLARGRVVIANVSRAVVAEAAAKFPVAVIEITAPREVLEARLQERGREDADDVARRLAREIELQLPVTRLRVLNDGSKEAGVQRLIAAIREAAGLDAVQGVSSSPSVSSRLGALTLLLPFLRPYRWRAIGAGTALGFAAGLVLLLGQGVRRMIDIGFATSDRAHLDGAALAMFAVVAALGISTGARFYLVNWLGERVAADLRAALFDRVLALSPHFFETMRTGDVLTRLNTDTVLLQGLVGAAVSQWLRSLVIALGALTMLVVTSPELAGLVVVVVPFVVLPLVVFGRRERRLARVAQDRVSDLGAYAEETINALRTVQAFTHEAQDRTLFRGRVEAAVQAAMRRVGVRATLLTLVILLGFGAIVLSLWVGGLDVVAGRLTGGELSAFVFYAVLVATSSAGIAELWGDVQRAGAAAERIGELLAEVPTVMAPAHPVALPPVRAGGSAVRFEAVSFRYPSRPDVSALEGFSLDVAPGETVALVGPSGAGKTTVFQLLLRFYDPAAGRVCLDAVDLRDADPVDVRGRIGLVSQDPVIFGADVWDNVRYGRPEATDAEVRDAVDAASAGFLAELPEGFGSFLGERGVRLSGGQRQRVAIARAVLRDAPVLLLDEATSALDAESEAAVQRALSALSAGRTTIVIAHRLATVRRADRIVVMERGRVVATGTHEALVREGGLYARLAALQFVE